MIKELSKIRENTLGLLKQCQEKEQEFFLKESIKLNFDCVKDLLG